MPAPQIIDLTHTLSPSQTPKIIYPGDPPFHLTPYATIAKDGYSVHILNTGTQSGTHIDAPCHFVEGGKSIDQIPLDDLVGRGYILDYTAVGSPRPELQLHARQKLEWDDLERVWKALRDTVEPSSAEETSIYESLTEELESRQYKFLLINTGWSEHSLDPTTEFDTSQFFGHPYFSPSIAKHLVSIGIKLFGMDLPNPDETPFESVGGEDGYAFHEVFLGEGGLIVENLANLKHLSIKGQGDWIINIIPLKLEGTDGSPVRAFAYREGSY